MEFADLLQGVRQLYKLSADVNWCSHIPALMQLQLLNRSIQNCVAVLKQPSANF